MSFEPLSQLNSLQLVRLYDRSFASDFPHIQQKPFTIVAKEQFGPGPHMPSLQFSFGEQAPVRCWFLDDTGTNLVQVQQDWVARNWRKIPKEAVYPRYTYLREEFRQSIELVSVFADEEGFGSLTPEHCEITYVNAILPIQGIWSNHKDASLIFRLWGDTSLGGSLPDLEDAQCNLSYLLEEENGPIGRLRIGLQPVFNIEDQVPTYLLTLTARGVPTGNGIAGVLAFLDLGHEKIVRAFDAVTATTLHEVWGKQ